MTRYRDTHTEDAGHEVSEGDGPGPGQGGQVTLDWAGEPRERRPRDVEPRAGGEEETGQIIMNIIKAPEDIHC